MTLVKWNPARELLNVEREFNKLFNTFNSRFGFDDSSMNEDLENAVWSPLTDISENKDQYILKMDLPRSGYYNWWNWNRSVSFQSSETGKGR